MQSNAVISEIAPSGSHITDELWTGGKCMYKLEPVLADEGELIIYAPHITEICVAHGKVIEEIGYHCRDYFLKQWEKFKQYPWGVLAHRKCAITILPMKSRKTGWTRILASDCGMNRSRNPPLQGWREVLSVYSQGVALRWFIGPPRVGMSKSGVMEIPFFGQR